MRNIILKVLQTIREYELLEERDRVLVGFSGGPDSTALLHILNTPYIKNKYKLELFAVHINHGIRGEEAQRDENFCKEIAEKWGIRLFIKRVNIPLIKAQLLGESEENIARIERYRIFNELVEEYKINKVALAHTLDDNVETLLLNLFKWGGKGVGGIPPKNNYIIRPLINIPKSQILEYLHHYNIPYVIDSSNLSTKYERNKVRLEILPVIEKNFPYAKTRIHHFSKLLQITNSFLDKTLKKHYLDFIQKEENKKFFLPKAWWNTLDYTEKEFLVFYILKSLSDYANYEFLLQLLNILHNPNIKEKIFNIGGILIKVKKEMEGIIVEKVEETLYAKDIEIEKKIVEEVWGKEKIREVAGMGIVAVDPEKIKGEIKARRRKEGDKVELENGQKKKLKDLLVDMKVFGSDKNEVVVLEDTLGIFAVVFPGKWVRVSKRVMVDEETKRMLLIIPKKT